MKVSKHHYALELAAQNCRVYFIEPPQLSHTGIEIKTCADHPLISIVNYKPVFRGKRFLPSFIYSFLLKQQVKALLKKINAKPDVVWSFQGYLFQNLQWFGAPVNLFLRPISSGMMSYHLKFVQQPFHSLYRILFMNGSKKAVNLYI